MFAALITSPRRFFTELEKNPRFAVPMILLLVANIGMIIWFYSTVDINAFVTQTLSARNLNAAQRAQAAAFMGRNTLMGSAVIGGIIGLFVVQLVEAFYYFFIYEFLDVRKSFRQWFALTWWCGLPALITAVGAAVMLLFSHSSGSLSVLSPFSLNALFYHFDPADTGYTLLNSITLVQLLSLALTVIGAHTWSQRSWALNGTVVILPRVLLYGIWGWWVFFR
ncbi:MAG TPA: YIP1 family protein [Steroidobacteraceae bacterium]|nr:YIP1 family protein [Steroidobacteraceae bacterium]